MQPGEIDPKEEESEEDEQLVTSLPLKQLKRHILEVRISLLSETVLHLGYKCLSMNYNFSKYLGIIKRVISFYSYPDINESN